jgi:hypothetical protein
LEGQVSIIPDSNRIWHKPVARFLLVVGAVSLVGALLYAYLPLGVDFFDLFWPIPREWLFQGIPVYAAKRSGFYNPPWTVLFLLPFSLLPVRVGMVALIVFSVGVLLWVLHTFACARPVSLLLPILALCNLHCFDLLQRGQIDAFALLGLALAFQAATRHKPWHLSAALLLISVKPINVLLPLLAVLWQIRQWAPRDLIKVFSLPLLALASSFPLFGWNWPARLAANFQHVTFQEAWMSTLWRELESLGLSLWLGIALGILAVSYLAWMAKRTGVGQRFLAVAQVVTLVFTPYAGAYNYVSILVVSLPELLARSWAAAWILWALTFLPILRLWVPITYWWLDIAFPLVARALFASQSFQRRPSEQLIG